MMYEVSDNTKAALQAAFADNVSSALIDAVEMLARIADRTEMLSMYPEKYKASALMGLNVDSFYLRKAVPEVENDFVVKGRCLKCLRSQQALETNDLTPEQYVEMIESRLLGIAPVLENMIKADERSVSDSESSIWLERNRKLLAEVKTLTAFFKSGPEPSAWMRFCEALGQQDRKSAEMALVALRSDEIGPQADRS